MEKIEETTESTIDSALLKSLAIAMPEAKISEYGIGFMIKITTRKIDPVQFSNLASISTIYKREIDIIPSKGQILVTLSERSEAEHV